MKDETRPIWPRRFPVYRAGALLLTLVCGALLIRVGGGEKPGHYGG